MSLSELETSKINLPSVLVIDDDRAMAGLLTGILQRAGYEVTQVLSIEAAREQINKQFFPIILSDINLGSNNGLDLLSLQRESTDKQLFIFITGDANVGTAMTAIRKGAFEYLSKPNNLGDLEKELLATVERASKRLAVSSSTSKGAVSTPTSAPIKRIVGKSLPMIGVYRAIANAALHQGNVLILGETGTGKEQIARTIHDNSQWADKPFIAVNCGALTDTLLESELFGHVKGAFTGATGNKRGLFEVATDGTIFLDEIGDVSLALQVKLLRTLQEKEIKPVGSSETKKINVRVIAATNRNLEQAIKDSQFREDLYYRLKVFLIEIPALRNRLDDLPELVNYFISDASFKASKGIAGLSEGVLAKLMQYSWPGNIRELENAVTHAVVSARSSVLFLEDFPREILGKGIIPVQSLPLNYNESTDTLEELEKNHILEVLRKVKNKKSKAAEMLGIDRVTLYRKITRYGIESDAHSDNTLDN